MLYNDYILKEDDVIDTIHGMEGYRVTRGEKGYYLHHDFLINREIYERLNMEWRDHANGCSYPVWPSLKDLTEEVKRLFAFSPYKLGDKVMVIPKKKGEKYPYGYNPQMEKYSGFIGKLVSIQSSSFKEGAAYNGDFHQYRIEDIGFLWHSSQFVPCTEEKKQQTDEPQREVKDPEILEGIEDFPNVCKGTTLQIGKFEYEVKGSLFGYYLDNKTGVNFQCFTDLGINDKERWCHDNGTIRNPNHNGDFPYHCSLADLKSCVFLLMKECKKKGVDFRMYGTDKKLFPPVQTVDWGISPKPGALSPFLVTAEPVPAKAPAKESSGKKELCALIMTEEEEPVMVIL